MYFAKDEIIELSDGKKYLVLNAAIHEDVVYYKIIEINEEEDEKIGEPVFITTINKQGRIYINNKLSDEETDLAKELFED